LEVPQKLKIDLLCEPCYPTSEYISEGY
jgi:hypothetical protein